MKCHLVPIVIISCFYPLPEAFPPKHAIEQQESAEVQRSRWGAEALPLPVFTADNRKDLTLKTTAGGETL